MHFSSIPLSLAALAPLANAFPAAIMEAAASDPALLARAAEMAQQLKGRQAGADGASAIFEPIPIFNEKAQFINVTKGSGHEYVAPGPNDLRGPCPGLNAFANHSVYTLDSLALSTDRFQTSYHTMDMLPSHSTSRPPRRWLAWAPTWPSSCPFLAAR